MQSSDTAKAAPAIAVRDLRNGDRVGGLIITEDTDILLHLQVECLVRQFHLTLPHAAVVAALAFDP